MHPDRVIVRMDIWSDVLSTIPDYLNTLTCQSSSTNGSPRYPLRSPVTTARTAPSTTHSPMASGDILPRFGPVYVYHNRGKKLTPGERRLRHWNHQHRHLTHSTNPQHRNTRPTKHNARPSWNTTHANPPPSLIIPLYRGGNMVVEAVVVAATKAKEAGSTVAPLHINTMVLGPPNTT